MTVADWLARVTADADSRGLMELAPLLQALARSTEALRAADAEFGHPAVEPAENRAAEQDGEHAEDAGRNGGH
ncbi:MAG TPA: hypothetical protein VH138_02970 [Vicinamibacterales bacterium]|jgi:hypothetical protein|nr:hypothetical protein [Vicinamibacterales bacterium]